MKTLTYLTSLVALTRSISADDRGPESPFGLTFSPSTVFASRYNSSGSIEIFRFPIPQDSAYHAYHRKAIQTTNTKSNARLDGQTYYTSPTHLAATSMFKALIDPVTASLKETLGHAPEYYTLFVPSIFEDRLRNAAADAISPNPLHQPAMHGPSQLAACHAFDFLSARYLNRAPEELNDMHGPSNLILLLEYEKEYLYVWLKEVAFGMGTYPVDSQIFCEECGGRFREEISAQVYTERVRSLLDTFTHSQKLKHHTRDDIRAFVIAGEASAESIAVLRSIVREVFGAQGLTEVTEFDPEEIVAHGAAEYVRMVQRKPHAFELSDWMIGVGHDEL